MTARNEHETPVIIIWALWQQFLPRKSEREIPIEIDARSPSGDKSSGWLNLKPDCVIQLPCRTLWPYFQYSRTFHDLFPVRYKLTPQALKFMHSHLVHLSHLFKCFSISRADLWSLGQVQSDSQCCKVNSFNLLKYFEIICALYFKLENYFELCLPGI